MRIRLPRSPLPLLRKELIEQANRRRTYALRTGYAFLLLLFFCIIAAETFTRASAYPMGLLGKGRELFDVLVSLQFAGICLFLPAMMCGAIVGEKERHTISLLLVTDLRPWELLAEKYLGQLLPMFTLLMLSLPPLALCYTMGGIPPEHLAAGVWMLGLTCLQVGAVALMCSACCRTTAQAFIAAYLLEALLFFGLPLGIFILHWLGLGGEPDEDMLLFFPPYCFFEFFDKGFWKGLAASSGVAASAVVCVLLARLFVVRRAFARPHHRLRRLLNAVDRAGAFAWGLVAGRSLRAGSADSLPIRHPVAWRECTKRLLGRTTHLLYVLAFFEVPVLLFCGVQVREAVRRDRHYGNEALTVIYLIAWGVVALVLVVRSAGLFTGERSDETLDVLLATPLTGREIVRQKMSSIYRLMLVAAVPLLTISLAESIAELRKYAPERAAYAATSVLSVLVYMPLLVWSSLWISLKLKARRRSIPAAVVAHVLFAFLPLLILLLVAMTVRLDIDDEPSSYLFLASPLSALVLSEIGQWHEPFGYSMPLAIAVNYAWYGALALAFRRLCVSRADRYFGRIPSAKGDESDGAAPGRLP